MSRSFLPIVLALLLPGAASAAVLSQGFEFMVTGFEGPVPSTGPAVGDTIGATFSFDTEETTPILQGFATGVLAIDGFGTTAGFRETVFGDNFGSDAGCCYDRIAFRSYLPSKLSIASLLLIDSDGEVLSGPGVPDTFDFDLIDWANLSVGLFEEQTTLNALYTRPEEPAEMPDMPPVPLPATLPLLLAGLGFLAMRRG